MKKHIITCAASILLLATACEKDVKIKVPDEPPKLVLNSLQPTGENIAIIGGKSTGVLQPRNGNYNALFEVTNAQVLVFENNLIYDTLKYNSPNYTYRTLLNKKFQLGKTYTIRASAPGFTPVEVQSTVPVPMVISNLARVRNARVNAAGETLDDIIVTFDDPPAAKNFYVLLVRKPFFGIGLYGSPDCLYSNDVDVERLTAGDGDPFGTNNCLDATQVLIRDDNFDGRTKNLRVSCLSDELRNYTDPATGRTLYPVVELRRITEDHFKYLKSRLLYTNAEGNPFAEPVQVFSNVKNGYGIFSVYTKAVDSIR